jgi:hypothetical protein
LKLGPLFVTNYILDQSYQNMTMIQVALLSFYSSLKKKVWSIFDMEKLL